MGELERAKTQLIGHCLREMEVRPTMMETYIRESQVYGEPLSTPYVLERIRNVSKMDVMNVAKNCLKSKPAVVLLGEIYSFVYGSYKFYSL